ncbi:MAG: hypothetical protein HC853_01705 [Anaerolineae bacterium]|nr:hypothetical protein [Anaerolineae bacterium]
MMNPDDATAPAWRYQAFVLRMWVDLDAISQTHTWRFSLEDVRTSQRRGFASLAELVAFLISQTHTSTPPNTN